MNQLDTNALGSDLAKNGWVLISSPVVSGVPNFVRGLGPVIPVRRLWKKLAMSVATDL
jgi:hypothetical protein